jgi:hypothetical protein
LWTVSGEQPQKSHPRANIEADAGHRSFDRVAARKHMAAWYCRPIPPKNEPTAPKGCSPGWGPSTTRDRSATSPPVQRPSAEPSVRSMSKRSTKRSTPGCLQLLGAADVRARWARSA